MDPVFHIDCVIQLLGNLSFKKKKIIELIKSIGGYHKKVKGIKNVREKKKKRAVKTFVFPEDDLY